jgi:regulator of nucleoside diphosphate kinase
MMAKHASKGAKPRITLTATDHERLSRLMLAASNTMPDLAADLAEELDRAHVLPAGRPANGIVCMGCEVEFRDDTTGRIQTVTLVFPDEADIAKGKISILTPIGVALIGLAIEKSISWETRRGDVRRLTVLSVREPQHTEMPPVADPSAVAPGAEAHPA